MNRKPESSKKNPDHRGFIKRASGTLAATLFVGSTISAMPEATSTPESITHAGAQRELIEL